MPRIVAKRSGRCSVCGSRIARGEYAVYTAATGTVHPECVGGKAVRTNVHPTACRACGRELGTGRARLDLIEHQVGDTFRKEWRATCLSGCR